MAEDISGSETWEATIAAPSDGDTSWGGSLITTLEKLSNRTKFLRADNSTILHDVILYSDTQSYTLNIENYTSLEIIAMIENGYARSAEISVYVNNDTTASNYYAQFIGAQNGTTSLLNEQSTAVVSTLTNGGSSLLMGSIMTGPTRLLSEWRRVEYEGSDNNNVTTFGLNYKGTNPSNITAITFSGNQTGALKTGSRFIIKAKDAGGTTVPGYSTSEVSTGQRWIDDSLIYRKVISLGALPNNTTKNVAHDITGIDYIVSIRGTSYKSSTSTFLPLPFADPSSNIALYVSGSDVVIAT